MNRKLVLTFNLLLTQFNLIGQDLYMKEDMKDYYIIDTIYIDNPIEVAHEKSGTTVYLVMPKEKLPDYSLEDNLVFLLGNSLLLPIVDDCEMKDAERGVYLTQQYKCNPKFFILTLMKQEYYIETMSYIGSKLRRFFKKDCDFIITATPVCDCD